MVRTPSTSCRSAGCPQLGSLACYALCIRIRHTESTLSPRLRRLRRLRLWSDPPCAGLVCWVRARNGSLLGLLSVFQDSSGLDLRGCWSGGADQGTDPGPGPYLRPCVPTGCARPAPAPVPLLLCPRPPSSPLAADLESCFLLGLQPVTAAALGAPGALAAPAAPGVARAPRAAAPPRDSSPAAVTMATPVRYGTLPASLSLSWFKLAAPALVRPQSQVPASNLLFC